MLVPRPPGADSSSRLACSESDRGALGHLEPKRPASDTLAAAPPPPRQSTSTSGGTLPASLGHRRALAALLRQSDSSTATDASDGAVLHAPPRRAHRSKALLKELHALTTVDDLVVREHEFRHVILSNETRQRNLMSAIKYDTLLVREEQQIIVDQETAKRQYTEKDEAARRLKELAVHGLVCEEYASRCKLASQYPPTKVTNAITDIRLRLLRLQEYWIRFHDIEATESVVFLESFSRYQIESEYCCDSPGVRAAVYQQLIAEQQWLDHKTEERTLAEMKEYVARDALEAAWHGGFSTIASHFLRNHRYLLHNDVQSIEQRRRLAVEHEETTARHSIIASASQSKRTVHGSLELSYQASAETRLRANLVLDESTEFRSIATASLRSWHQLYELLLQKKEFFSVTVEAERQQRMDVEAAYRVELHALQQKSDVHHQFVSLRDWERRHIIDSYLDGRFALWRHQEQLVDDYYQTFQRELHLLGTQRWSVVLEAEEAEKRSVINIQQWKVFMLFYLWSAAQRYKIDAVRALGKVAEDEAAARGRLMQWFAEEGERVATGPLWVTINLESEARTAVVEHQLDERLRLYRYFKEGRSDLTRVSLEVGSVLIASVEHTERERISLIESWEWYDILLTERHDLVLFDKLVSMTRREQMERCIVYGRILDFVGDLHREDLYFEEHASRSEIEQLRVLDCELTNRVAIQQNEETRFMLLKKLLSAPSASILGLWVNELENRGSLVHEATVAMNAAVTRFVCQLHAAVTIPMRFVDYHQPQVLEELRLLDAGQFIEDLKKEMATVRTIDEPVHRYAIYAVEREECAVLLVVLQEIQSRHFIMRQQARDLHATHDAVARMQARDSDFHAELNGRQLAHFTTEALNAVEIDERAALLHLLTCQEELYRQAEEAIRLRMLLDEGPLLKAYFAGVEDLATQEELQRAALHADLQAEGIAIQQLVLRRILDEEAAAMAAAPPGESDSQAPPPSQSHTSLLDASALTTTSEGQNTSLMMSPGTLVSHWRGRVPLSYELSLHSVQVSIHRKWGENESSTSVAPVQLFLAYANFATHQTSKSPRKIRSADRHRGSAKAAADDEDETVFVYVETEETQKVTIGSKTLFILQPTDHASSENVSHSRWEIVSSHRGDVPPSPSSSSAAQSDPVITIFAEIRMGDTVLLRITKSFSLEDCEESREGGVISVPLQSAQHGVSGKVNFIIDVK